MLENPITIFNSIAGLEGKKIYVTDEAMGYFKTIRTELDNISMDLVEEETRTGALTPRNFDWCMEFYETINQLEKFLENANKNDRKSADKVIGLKNILIKFDFIKKMMLSSNPKLRKDAYELFINTGNSYSEEEISEFVGWLDENETYNIYEIIHVAEKTIIDKQLTNTPIHHYIDEKMKRLQQNQITAKNSIGIPDEGR